MRFIAAPILRPVTSRRKASVGMVLSGPAELSFMVGGRPESRGKRRPFSPDTPSPEVDAFLVTDLLQRALARSHKGISQTLRYLLKKSRVRCQANLAAASS